MNEIKNLKADELDVRIYPSRKAMGEAAARDISARIAALLARKESINMIFAAAPSQNEVLSALVADRSIEWNRVRAYHMDEYIGLNKSDPRTFGNFLREHIFDRVAMRSVQYIDCEAQDPSAEARRYEKILRENPPDIVLMGIGENGHIAFNDPPVADFDDPLGVKTVELDETCRNQQVHDGCFDNLDSVPKYAITLTVPMLVSAANLFCVVPASTKADAVRACVTGGIDESCPASILRTRKGAILYLDADSAAKL